MYFLSGSVMYTIYDVISLSMVYRGNNPQKASIYFNAKTFFTGLHETHYHILIKQHYSIQKYFEG